MSLSLEYLDPFDSHPPTKLGHFINQNGFYSGRVLKMCHSPSGSWLGTLSMHPTPSADGKEKSLFARCDLWNPLVGGAPLVTMPLITELPRNCTAVSLFFEATLGHPGDSVPFYLTVAFSSGRLVSFSLPSGVLFSDKLICFNKDSLTLDQNGANPNEDGAHLKRTFDQKQFP